MAPPVPVLRVSHAVEKICHRLLILCIRGEAVSEASGHLAIELLGLGQVAPLGQDLGFVDVGVVAAHGLSRLVWDNSTGSGGQRRLHTDSLQIDLGPIVSLICLQALAAGIGAGLAIEQGNAVDAFVIPASGDNVNLHGLSRVVDLISIGQGQEHQWAACASSATVHQTNKTPPRVCNLEGGRGGKGEALGALSIFNPLQ